jgi:hypothetical protein
MPILKRKEQVSDVDAEVATLKTRELSLLASQTEAKATLNDLRNSHTTMLLDGIDGPEQLGAASARIAEAEHTLRGLDDAVSVVSQKLHQAIGRQNVEKRWALRRTISENKRTAVTRLTELHARLIPLLRECTEVITPVNDVFEASQIKERCEVQARELDIAIPVVCAELERHAMVLLNPDAPEVAVVGSGAPPLPADPITLPQTLGKPAGMASVRPGAEWPPRRGPHSNYPLGEVPTPKQPPTRDEILAQNKAAYKQMWPGLVSDDEDALSIFAKERQRLSEG